MQLRISLLFFKPTLLGRNNVLMYKRGVVHNTESQLEVLRMDRSISSFKLEYQISNYSNAELIVKTQGGLNYIIRRQERMISQNHVSREVHVKISGVKADNFWIDSRLA